MTLKRLLLIIAGAVAVLGSFLPWYKISMFGYSQSSNAFQMGALYIILSILMIIAAAVVIVLSAVKEKQIQKIVKIKDAMKAVLIVGITMAVISMIAFIAIQSESKGFGGASWGIWLMILASAGTIVLAAMKVEQLDKVVIGEAEKPAKKAPTKKSSKK